MIPILYAASETDFTTNGIGLLTDAVSCTVTEEKNGAYEATLVYPTKGHLAEYIVEDAIIKTKANDTDELQLFRIYKSGKQLGGNTTWNAEHISYELTGNPVERFSVSGVNAAQALNKLLSAAAFKHKYTATSDITTVNSTSIADVVSVRKALGGVEGSILDTWGGEYHFNNYRIELLKARGADNGVTIEYGKNLTDAKQERNIANIVTAIFPYAKYTPEGEENEVYVSLKEKTLVHAGAADYAYKRCEIVDFSSEWESGTIITEDMLRAKAEAYLKKISTEPDINITLSYAQLKKTKDYKNIQAMESVALCDKVTVRIDKLQIEATAKIVKAKYDSLKERYDTMEIGSVRTNLTKQLTATQQEVTENIKKNQTRAEQIKKKIEQTIVDVTAAITGNSGGYVVLYPEKNPQEIMILDTPNVNTAKNVWRWNLAGLGHSSTGVNGTFTTAITADGKIVADFIATGELNGLLIKAGTIEADAISIGYKNLVTKEINEKGELITADYTTKFETTADSITAEVTRATTAEGTLSSSIKSTADSITTEVKRAKGVEGDLSSKISQNADSITAEVTRATTAEGTLSSSIKSTADSITAEVTRATTAEGDLSSSIKANAKKIETKVTADDVSSQIEQSAESIRCQAKKISWKSDNSEMTEDGELTCNNINIQNGKVFIKQEGDEAKFEIRDSNGKRGFRLHKANLYGYNSLGKITLTLGNEAMGFITCRYKNGDDYPASSLGFGNLQIKKSNTEYTNITATGLSCTGTKNRIVNTPNYNDRLLYCYETPSPMFGDVGAAQIDDTGKCLIFLDEKFSQTIDLEYQYDVFLTKYGPGDCYVSERTPSYFVVEGTKNLKFAWEIKSIQRDYENLRLEEYTLEQNDTDNIYDVSEYLNTLLYQLD